MTTSSRVLLLLFAVICSQAQEFVYSRIVHSNVSCIESERQALLMFKDSLIDRKNRLSSWVGHDCCAWKGVSCNKKTGHIVMLDLHNPTSFNALEAMISSFSLFSLFDINYDRYLNKYKETCLRGNINPSLLELKHLQYLDLSMNDFSGIHIPKFLGSLENLIYLNLSYAGFGGNVPHHLGNLSRLQFLDLGNGIADNEVSILYVPSQHSLAVDTLWWASALSSLQHLNLAGVNLTKSTDWLQAINMLPSLSVLNLAYCEFGKIPPLLHLNFTSLASLDLRGNNIDTLPPWFLNMSSLLHLRLDKNSFESPVFDILGKLTSLTLISLSFNSFNSSFPVSFCNLSSLVYMDLSWNRFNGPIPTCLKNFCFLSVLNLFYNKFGGPVNFIEGSSSGCLHYSLTELYLSSNQFESNLPSELGEFSKLEHLYLDDNRFHGPIPESFGMLTYLTGLSISDNKLNGSIPISLGQLSQLSLLDVSNNSLSGTLSELHFAKLSKLEVLYLSSNLLHINLSSGWIPPFQLSSLEMESCMMGPQFPQWLRTQKGLASMNLSNAGIMDELPGWFENIFSRINVLDMSHNQISGKLPNFEECEDCFTRYLVLKSNRFEGPLTPIPPDVDIIDFSDNFLSGHIPFIDKNMSIGIRFLILSNNSLAGGTSMLCNMMFLFHVDISKNHFSEKLPACLGDMPFLFSLELSDNGFYGHLPHTLGSAQSLIYLNLHNNKFQGRLPLSFQNLTELDTLDLGENAFNDTIPPWIGEKLSNLKILSLQSNHFHGEIPSQLCQLSSLQVLSLAHNNITGSIPSCFGNFTGMVVTHSAAEFINRIELFTVIFERKILETIKGRQLEYTKNLGFLTTIDLSDNNIVDDIPQEIMGLFGLVNLNLARNQLKGRIPTAISNLKQLESLDLSRNELSGPIPPGLAALTFLSHLNLSFNELSGRIPTGNQLQSLEDQESIYMGNSQLCGAPLLKLCPGDKTPNDHETPTERTNEDGDESFFLWFSAGIGPGFVVGFLGFCAAVHFNKSLRQTLFGFVEDVFYRLQRTFHDD